MSAGGAGPRIGLALGGGGARGLAHLHVIEALDELGLPPAAISGTSIGALMGAGMAAGMTGRAIREHLRMSLSSRAAVARRIWQARPATARDALRNGLRLGQFDLERILESFLPDAVPARFEALAIPLAVVATDFYGNRAAVFREGALRSALAASAALPALFRPVWRDGVVLIDGGLADPLPFGVLEGSADIVIAVDVVGAPSARPDGRLGAVEAMFGASQLLQQSVIAARLERRAPEILLRPPVSRFRVLDFLKLDAVLAETAALKEEAKRAVADALARWEARARAG